MDTGEWGNSQTSQKWAGDIQAGIVWVGAEGLRAVTVYGVRVGENR